MAGIKGFLALINICLYKSNIIFYDYVKCMCTSAYSTVSSLKIVGCKHNYTKKVMTNTYCPFLPSQSVPLPEKPVIQVQL